MARFGKALRPRRAATYRGRLVSSFIAIILLSFFILSIIFYTTVTTALGRNRARQLNAAVAELAAIVAERCEEGTDLKTDPAVVFYMSFIRRSLGSYVWLVAPDGQLVAATGFPPEVSDRLDAGTSEELPRLPQLFVGEDLTSTGYTFIGGNFLGLFDPPGNQRWISVIRPVHDSAGELKIIVQIHDRFDMSEDSRSYMLNGVGLAILVALIAALVIVLIFSNSVSRPIRELSDAARAVMQGDYTVRVPEPRPEPEKRDEASERTESADEITFLVRSFNLMAESLELQNTDRRDFISAISHDLRTPLTSIRGFIEGMLDGTIPPERFPRYLGIVRDETERLTKLVNAMNEVNELDGGALNFHFANFDITALIRQVVRSLESLIEARSLTVQTSQTPDCEPLLVVGDEEQIGRVLYNLLSNAIRHAPEAGILSVTWQRGAGGRCLEVVVEDNGPGISDEDLPHIFERFYKSDRARTRHSGSGLGLFISRGILTAHGQKITAGRSRMGGARFAFTLKLA
ncbi:MAG: HAMP domain-containing sensor histidine kinase [Bacillota bacterium]|nr:HAMP domain-containing sensor histidine kinase [Bacillota bacterium]